MRIINKKGLEKLKFKNRGNVPLVKSVDLLIWDIQNNNFENHEELKNVRLDANCIHNDGFYFFNISIHRTIILIEFSNNEATIVWQDHHKEYERVFKNNKATIHKWLKSKGWI